MKKFLFLLFMVILLTGCSAPEWESIEMEAEVINQSVTSDTRSLNEALLIAKRALQTITTRSSFAQPKINYIIDNSNSRAENHSSDTDTLGYIFNFEENGFAIISTNRSVNPVLAFSPEGEFVMNNDMVNKNFIVNIKQYYNKNTRSESYDENFESCYVSIPYVKANLDQYDPWNKYVVIEHPNCPVGCVALATASVMINSKLALYFHGSTLQFKSIILALEEVLQSPTPVFGHMPSINKRITGRPRIPKYSYEQAVDSMAKILYYLGQDLKITYSPNGSSGFSNNAFNLCKNLGYSLSSGYEAYDLVSVFNYLRDNHIIYMTGRDYSQNVGHAFVCDGYSYCTDLYDATQITERYLHVDWGAGGACNGYYNGEIFNCGTYYSFKPNYYFAVKRDADLEAYIVVDN